MHMIEVPRAAAGTITHFRVRSEQILRRVSSGILRKNWSLCLAHTRSAIAMRKAIFSQYSFP